VLKSVNPAALRVVQTYAAGREFPIDLLADAGEMTDEHACLAVQQPNYLGYLEPVEALGRASRAVGALFVVSADPISLGLLRPPGAYGADLAVAEGQSLGCGLNYGGPYLGLFTCREQYIRQMPGRIVGRTHDVKGRAAYVLTLQTREQHIRRERATSNICTSEQLLALAAAVYLAAVGPRGLRQIAEACFHKAHYAANRIAELPGYRLAYDTAFFQEFAVHCPRPPAQVLSALLDRGILGGIDVSDQIENGLLICVTEMNPRAEIDRFVEALAEYAR
ncbi:MAG: glycine dehydrogenase, partial [Dehalococcoidia bacterium]